MKKSTLALAVSVGVVATQAGAAGFFDDSKASVSSRTMYFENDNRQQFTATKASDQRETAEGLIFNFISGYTPGTVGFGLDLQGMAGIHLGGGITHHNNTTANTFFPTDTDGSSVDDWARLGANAKVKLSKTELKLGNALQPNLPILVANDGRLLPQTFEGGIVTSKEIDSLTLTAGKLDKGASRASSNYAGMAVAGGTQDSNSFTFAGADWKVTKDLTLQAYHSQLEDYYKQTFLGLVHVFPIADDQSFKTDLRYFDSRSDGKNGDVGYRFNNNGGYARNAGEVDNKTWSAMFTYTLGGHALMLGHQQVNDDGGFVWMNNGNITKNGGAASVNNAIEGEGGSSFYLFTDSMINQFARAGETTNFGQYSYDFARLGVPGLKAAFAYLKGTNIKATSGASVGDSSEWERDVRLDYVFQEGLLKGFGATIRRGNYRSDYADHGTAAQNTRIADQDQTRLIFNYTYAFK